MNNLDNQLTWVIVISIALFIISLLFNIFFLINGLLSLGLGIYYIVSVNKEISNLKDGIDSDLLYGYSLFLSWTVLVLGIISIFIYIVLQFMNRGKSVSVSSNKNFSKNNAIKKNYRTNQYYVNTNRYLKE
jgi:predicted membrane protein